ncbi:MAG: penicillin-binding protein 2 [Desulforegulaceae bacterium]|nr:penicillin-binding protein 2 [Desulforegulaceae bacterium]
MRIKEKKAATNSVLRIKIIKYIAYLCLFLIIGRAFVIQNFSCPALKKITLNTYSKKIEVNEKRGTIFDRNKEVLAISLDAWDLALRPEFKQNFSDYQTISEITGLKKSEVKTKFDSSSSFVYLKRKASKNEVEKIHALEKKLNLDHRLFEVIKTSKRVYPNKNLGAPIIGFTNLNQQRTGAEYTYNHLLEGSTTQIPIISAGKGNWYKNPDFNHKTNPGNDIYLTIDKNIQYIAEQALERIVTKFKAKDGKAVVINPNTGEVLAMAQYPFFNPNVYWKSDPQSWNNRNTLDAFEPGSILKIFLAAGAIDKEFCSKNSIFYCQDGKYKIGSVTIHDTKPHKWLQVSEIIKFSSNIGAVKIGELVGRESLYQILKDFGFAKKTGLDVPIETSGVLREPNLWTKVDTSNISFGHGMSASSVQLATAVSTIANKGYLLKPYLLKKITNPLGEEIFSNTKKIKKRVISEKTAIAITKMMEKTITEGTGSNAAPKGYSAAGKTGTSQKLEPNGKYSREKYISTFLGFAPADKAEIAVMVAINEPIEGYYGGIVAAPVFKEIATKTLSYMNVLPEGITIALSRGTNEVR